MKTMRWIEMAGVAATVVMMIAAGAAGAQTVPAAAQMADAQARMAAVQAEVEVQGARLEANSVAMRARMRAQSAELQAQMLPMQARMEIMMAPMQAEMVARGARMQAAMMAVGDPQVKDDLFAGTEKFANGASDVTDVNLGPDMLGMVSGKHGGDVAHKMNFMVVRSYTYPRAGMYNMADVEAYRQKLRRGNWNCFIHTYESKSGESTDICNRALPNDGGNEMVILTVEPKELTFVHMSGKGSLADLGKLGALGGYGGAIPTPPAPPAPPMPPVEPK